MVLDGLGSYDNGLSFIIHPKLPDKDPARCQGGIASIVCEKSASSVLAVYGSLLNGICMLYWQQLAVFTSLC